MPTVDQRLKLLGLIIVVLAHCRGRFPRFFSPFLSALDPLAHSLVVLRFTSPLSRSLPSHRTLPFSPLPPLSSTAAGERAVRRLRLSKALTLPDTTTVADACRRMANRRVDACLLTDSSALLCGIMTDRDLALKCVGEGLDVNSTLASAVMTKNPTFVTIDSSAVDKRTATHGAG
ncbi:unnamed protein product, partial [Closterium sp. Yama58-4]